MGAPAFAQAVNSGHVEMELAPLTATVQPGTTTYVALREKIAPRWHTYWKNAGDAGLPPTLTWTLPSGWKAGDTVWPRPQRLPQWQLMTYGYEGQVFLPVAIKVPASATNGDRAAIAAHVEILVCKDVCIPETADLKLALPVSTAIPEVSPQWGADVARALAEAPKPATFAASANYAKGVITLAAAGAPLKGVDANGAYFFPDDASMVLLPARQAVERGPDGLTLTLKPSPVLAKAGALSAPLTGLLATKSSAWEISARPNAPPPPGASGLGPALAAGDAPKNANSGIGGLLTALGFALLGGMVLNLMPCVFPVLSMKAAALAARAHAPEEARRDGLFFLAGTLSAFLVLAVVVVAGKAAGQALGWGFQLQSPKVTAALTLLTLAIALNLSGVFEAGLTLQGVGGDLQRKPGAAGAFFTGVLAVVVGAPCTAPFMASALGYALTAGAVATFVVFLALGLGLALPFVALSFSPALLRRLPKPGVWMDTLRKLLAFPMYATAAFMAWVFAQQSGGPALGLLMGATVTLALCLYLYGLHQQAYVEGRRSTASLVAAGAALIGALALAGFAAASETEPNAVVAEGGPSSVHAEPYSAERLAALRAQGKPVFVNFTAAWCVSCKVNEAVAFSSADTAKAFADTGAAYLVGDWTRRDAAITQALTAQGRTGVPLYLVYGVDGGEPKVLPQVLTSGAVVRALKAAARTG
ncbi:MAG TPA: protein-disulfide reductase DsbD domain-containing protein [Caulobacteraceae bacterium]|nr:protein-disulfide reductase DsbD domain-containing protein [Caulobacteraceae bacterium]